MTQCTSTGKHISVLEGASLVMEDCRVFGSNWGIFCLGDVKMTHCIIENNGIGVVIYAEDGERTSYRASGELVN